MLLFILLAALIIALMLLTRPRQSTPARCRCGRQAEIIDDEQPWRVWCARCWLRRRYTR